MDKRVGSSIIGHFSLLTDPRILLKNKHKLIDIVVITVCATLAGADDWVEIACFGRVREDWFRTFLELPNGIPCHDTFGRVFARIEPEEFGKCLMSWIRDVFPSTGTDVIAIDGKTSRRSHDRANGKGPIHMVNAWAVENRLITGQVKNEDKSNEIKAIPELPKIIDIKGCVVTTDAMGCQKEIAKQIVEQGGDYMLALKGNQGTLPKEVELLFEKAKEDHYEDLPHDSHATVDGGHGRIETQTYKTIGDVD
jgi:predicted transposase YbfD/YdcC